MKCHSLLWRTKWPRRLERWSAAAELLGLWVRIPPGTWIPVPCACCVLSGSGLCDGLITRPEESYRLCCVLSKCHREASILRRPWPTGGGGWGGCVAPWVRGSSLLYSSCMVRSRTEATEFSLVFLVCIEMVWVYISLTFSYCASSI